MPTYRNRQPVSTDTPAGQLPRWLLDTISAPPEQGIHAWLFKIARQLWAHRTRAEIIAILSTAADGARRSVPRREIESAVDDARQCAWQPGQITTTATRPAPKWPAVNQEQREAVLASGLGLADLEEASPIRFDDDKPHTEEIVDALFPGNPPLCCGMASHSFATKAREEWRGTLARHALIVPSPMSAPIGKTKDGRESAHTLDNTGPRRFLVIEFDTGTADEHAATLLHLAGRAPLVLAVHSGGKSLHGWFFCEGQPEPMLEKFMRHAATLGADPATWTRSQFVRMPDGTRDNGNRQTVFFFNPEPIKAKQ